jgi:serine/threonine protein kinase
MMCGLHAAKIAHGDLQNENILLRRNSRGEVEIRLIDYDTLAVPENYGTPTDNEGFPAFQHPTHKAPRSLGPRDDAFASLVIYLSILALAEDPDLWNDYGLDHCDKDNLLFTREDLLGPAPSEKFHRLRGLSQTVSNLTLILWNFLCCPSERHLPCLEDVVALASAELPVRDPAKAGGFDERIRRTKEWSRLAAERLPSTAVRKSAWLEEWDGEPARLLPK